MGRFDLRQVAGWFKGRDRSIVNPSRLSAARSNDVCGACHAGRTLLDVAALDRWMDSGPSFRPGDDLSLHLKVLDAATPSPAAHMPDMFKNRFWQDGSPRLTAYEYQGLKASACAVDQDMSCVRATPCTAAIRRACCPRPAVVMRNACVAIYRSRPSSTAIPGMRPSRRDRAACPAICRARSTV